MVVTVHVSALHTTSAHNRRYPLESRGFSIAACSRLNRDLLRLTCAVLPTRERDGHIARHVEANRLCTPRAAGRLGGSRRVRAGLCIVHW